MSTNASRFQHPDADRTRLRTIVASIDRELSAGGAVADTGRLRASWAELVAALALGPQPEVRACPFCGYPGMRAATRCGNCWRKLTPVAPGTP